MKNTQQKELILALRDQGMSYKEIATKLGVLETYPRTICSRAKRAQIPSHPKGTCRYCGATLIHTEGYKPKQFCSDVCRYKFHNCEKLFKRYICTCERCGVEFVSKGFPGRRFCSRDCRTLASREAKLYESSET